MCDRCRDRGVIIRPLGNAVVLMPPFGMTDGHLAELADIVVHELGKLG